MSISTLQEAPRLCDRIFNTRSGFIRLWGYTSLFLEVIVKRKNEHLHFEAQGPLHGTLNQALHRDLKADRQNSLPFNIFPTSHISNPPH
jgi:hypothetical protein